MLFIHYSFSAMSDSFFILAFACKKKKFLYVSLTILEVALSTTLSQMATSKIKVLLQWTHHFSYDQVFTLITSAILFRCSAYGCGFSVCNINLYAGWKGKCACNFCSTHSILHTIQNTWYQWSFVEWAVFMIQIYLLRK